MNHPMGRTGPIIDETCMRSLIVLKSGLIREQIETSNAFAKRTRNPAFHIIGR